MTRHPRTVRLPLAGAAAAAVLLLSGCGSPVRAGAAAVVGDTRITTEQLATQVDQGLADPGASSLAADRPTYQRALLGRIIDADILERVARDKGVSVTPSDVDAQYAQLEAANGGPGGLLKAAGAQGYSPAEVRQQARLAALQQAIGDALTADVPVSATQLASAYQADLDRFDQVRVAQVQLASPAEAQALLAQATTLSDAAFTDLARSRSLDQASKTDGGDLGLQPRSAFTGERQELGNRAFAAKAGDTFTVPGPAGSALVVRVLQRRTTTPQQATPQLRRSLLADQRGAALTALATSTADRLHIKVNPRFGSWDPKQLSVVAATDTGNREVSSPAAPQGGPAALRSAP